MSKKHIMNAGICCICTAVIFGLHFFVYGRMLLDNAQRAVRARLRQTECLEHTALLALGAG